jgi:hypothetical protein
LSGALGLTLCLERCLLSLTRSLLSLTLCLTRSLLSLLGKSHSLLLLLRGRSLGNVARCCRGAH